MARYKGHDGAITAGGADVGEIESFDITISSNELDANVMGNDWTDVEGGQKSANGSINVLRDRADAGQAELTVGSTVALVLYTEGNTTSLTQISGDFLITEKGITTSVGDLVKTAYTVRNKGTIAEAAVV